MFKLNFIVLCSGWGLALWSCNSSSLQPLRDGAAGDTAAINRAVDCAGDCAFTATYTVSTVGFFALDDAKAVLSPPSGYQHFEYFSPDGGATDGVMCAPAIQPCTQGGPVSACDIAQDLADPIVQSALAQPTPPFFGANNLGIDGNAFQFKRDDGRGFLVGDDVCQAPGCVPVPVPPAIARLKADLQKLDAAMIASPACTALNVRLTTAGSR
ncbi:MAG: hypothetical protein ABUS79_18525 [Pseudomonadota bacterium]